MLRIRDLHLSRGSKQICEGLHVELDKGQCMLLSGPHGSGKTSLLLCFLGLLRPSKGQVELDLHDLHHLRPDERKKFLESAGILFQESSLSPYETVHHVLEHHHLPSSSQDEFLERIGMKEFSHQKVAELSALQKKILELGSLLLRSPLLLLLDDPLSGLDDSTREKFLEQLLDCKRAQRTLIIATPNPHQYNILNPEKIIQLSPVS